MDERAGSQQETCIKFYAAAQDRLVRWQAERATVTQIILAGAVALGAAMIPARASAGGAYKFLAVIIVFIGGIGFVFVNKYHERIQYHRTIMEKLLQDIGGNMPGIVREAEEETRVKYGHWYKLSLYKVYSRLMLAIILFGGAVIVFG